MIGIGTAVAGMTQMSFLDVLWHLPAAVAYQVNLLYWQHEGNEFVVDDRERIREVLCRKLK